MLQKVVCIGGQNKLQSLSITDAVRKTLAMTKTIRVIANEKRALATTNQVKKIHFKESLYSK